MPLVSFNIVTFNRASFLKKCLASVQCQTFKDFEVIIVDDGSTDDTKNIVDSFKDLPIKYYKNEVNSGIAFSRNRAALLSEGKYIAILDSDDECLPDRLLYSIDVIDKNDSIDIVFGNALFKGKIVEKIYQEPTNNIFLNLFFENPIIHSTVLIRRSLLTENWYDADFSVCEDFELWTRIVTPTNFYKIEKPLVIYNTHSENVSSKKFEQMQSFYFDIVFRNLSKKLRIQMPKGLKKNAAIYNPVEIINVASGLIFQSNKISISYPFIDSLSFKMKAEIFFKKFKYSILKHFFNKNKTYKRLKYYFVCFPDLIVSQGVYQTLKLLVNITMNRVSD